MVLKSKHACMHGRLVNDQSSSKISMGLWMPSIEPMSIISAYYTIQYSAIISRPESNVLKNLPKMLPGISQKFHLLCFSVFLLCLHYAPKLPTILSIVMENFK